MVELSAFLYSVGSTSRIDQVSNSYCPDYSVGLGRGDVYEDFVLILGF